MFAKNSSKGKAGMIIAIVIVVAVVGVIAGIVYNIFFNKKYVAVSLVTGEIYYGKLVKYPHQYRLYDAWYLQGDAQGNVGLQSFDGAFWMPTGPMIIEKDKVVLYAGLSEDSPIRKAMRGEAIGNAPTDQQMQQQQMQQQQMQQQQMQQQQQPTMPSGMTEEGGAEESSN